MLTNFTRAAARRSLAKRGPSAERARGLHPLRMRMRLLCQDSASEDEPELLDTDEAATAKEVLEMSYAKLLSKGVDEDEL